MVVEIGIKLDKSLDYYHDLLLSHGAKNVWNIATHDIYWSDKNFDGMSENEIKRSCIRFRYSEGFGGSLFDRDSFPKSGFQNYLIFGCSVEDC